MKDSKPQQFTKKPITIEALQWNGPDDDMAFSRFVPHNLWCRNSFGEPCVKTLESGQGFHVVSTGDYIIRGVKGEFYPCKPDIFEATYLPAVGAAGSERKAFDQKVAKLTDVLDKLRPGTGPAIRMFLQDAYEQGWQAARAAAPPNEKIEELQRQRDEYKETAYRLENTIRLLRTEAATPVQETKS